MKIAAIRTIALSCTVDPPYASAAGVSDDAAHIVEHLPALLVEIVRHLAGRRVGAGNRPGDDKRPAPAGTGDRIGVAGPGNIDAAPFLHDLLLRWTLGDDREQARRTQRERGR